MLIFSLGKSTFLRQNALLVILAQVRITVTLLSHCHSYFHQIGCFVPAESAKIGWLDVHVFNLAILVMLKFY